MRGTQVLPPPSTTVSRIAAVSLTAVPCALCASNMEGQAEVATVDRKSGKPLNGTLKYVIWQCASCARAFQDRHRIQARHAYYYSACALGEDMLPAGSGTA